MGSRAFESYIYDKIKSGEKRSDYLVYGTENKYYPGMKPYPEGPERAAINGAFDKLFSTMKTKPSEKGGITLYSSILPGVSPEAVKRAVTTFQEKVASPLLELYKKPPTVTESKKIIGEYLGERQRTELKLTQEAQKINREFDPLTQRAIARYMEANGDEVTLRRWANESKQLGLKRVYEKALQLNEKEKALALGGAKLFDEGLQTAIEHGIIEDGVEN
jgi:hypothetical protein